MIVRFYLYSIFKNLTFADAFLFLYLLHLGYPFLTIGWMLGMQNLVAVLLELPGGILADHWGRGRILAAGFLAYTVSFSCFAFLPPSVYVLLTALLLFAVGEAFRSGAHKAIILSYLQRVGTPELATQVIGRTRSVSKFTSATSAIAAGIILYWFRDFYWLFLFSAFTSLLGFGLILSYPRELQRDTESEGPQSRRPWLSLTGLYREDQRHAFTRLLWQSVVFESQCKMILKYFLQPFVDAGLQTLGISLLGQSDRSSEAIGTGAGQGDETMESTEGTAAEGSGGAFWIGVNEFLRDGTGGWGARSSQHFDDPQHRRIQLNRMFALGFGISIAVAGASWNLRWGFVPGVVLLLGLTFLQNLRRPVFLAAFDATIRAQNRSTALAVERVARAMMVAILMPIYGWAADTLGWPGIWSLTTVVFALGLISQWPAPSES